MASKKRRFEQLQAAAAAPREKKSYVYPFQQQVVPRIENVGKLLEGKGKMITYALGALVLVVVIVLVIMSLSRRSSGAAQAALGKAIETSSAQISETIAPAGSS